MSGDHARFSFDPHNAFSGVWDQQGRVSLEADANEFEQILDRLRRATTYDTVGAGVVPATTPDGFNLGVGTDGTLTIGVGRAYVDGLLAECFGTGTATFDSHIGHQHGDALPVTEQPFLYEDIPSVPDEGPQRLVYLDVWQREVTVYEHPDLREPALGGPDTTTRVQTAWQVKALVPDDDEAPPSPAECDADWSGWDNLVAPSTARLTVTVDPAPTEPPPCEVPAKAGYVGLENRLYRAEVHTSGNLGDPNALPEIKWSRDNASVAATVTKITRSGAGSKITVTSTGRDAFQRFEKDQYIELLDDWVEFAMRDEGRGGDLARIESVNHETGEIVTDTDLSGFDVKKERHPRIRRWDIAKPGDPVLNKPVAGTPIELEDGISVTFGPAGGLMRAGDHWVFSARTATGATLPEVIEDAPPRGVLHHFMKLGVVTPGNPPTIDHDCRVIWPTSCGGCECDFCVTVESHVSGALTIQQAIDEAVAQGGGVVCLGTGEFPLNAGLTLNDAVAVRIRGSGPGTVLLADTRGTALAIRNAVGIEVSDLTLVTFGEREELASAIDVTNAALLTLDGLLVIENLHAVIEATQDWRPDDMHGPAIRLKGLLARGTVSDCVLVGGEGVSDYRPSAPPVAPDDETSLMAISTVIRSNTIFAANYGVALDSTGTIFADRLEIESNSVFTLREGISIEGWLAVGIVRVCQNSVCAGLAGITVEIEDNPDDRETTAQANTAVEANTIVGLTFPSRNGEQFPEAGITVDAHESATLVRVANNSIQTFRCGIEIDGDFEYLQIVDNTITECVGGVYMDGGSYAKTSRVTGNTVRTVAGDPLVQGFNAGIVMSGSGHVDITHNFVHRPEEREHSEDYAIAVYGCEVAKIADNMIEDFGSREPDDGGGQVHRTAGIYSPSAFGVIDITGNTARQIVMPEESRRPWNAVYIGDPTDGRTRQRSRVVATRDAVYWRSDYGLIRLAGKEDEQIPLDARESNGEEALLSIRGNTLQSARKQNPTVNVLVELDKYAPRHRCTFADNICRHDQPEVAPVALGTEGVPLSSLVLSDNQVWFLRRDTETAITAWAYGVWTVVGNVTWGAIQIDGTDLEGNPHNEEQWKFLNRRQ